MNENKKSFFIYFQTPLKKQRWQGQLIYIIKYKIKPVNYPFRAFCIM